MIGGLSVMIWPVAGRDKFFRRLGGAGRGRGGLLRRSLARISARQRRGRRRVAGPAANTANIAAPGKSVRAGAGATGAAGGFSGPAGRRPVLGGNWTKPTLSPILGGGGGGGAAGGNRLWELRPATAAAKAAARLRRSPAEAAMTSDCRAGVGGERAPVRPTGSRRRGTAGSALSEVRNWRRGDWRRPGPPAQQRPACGDGGAAGWRIHFDQFFLKKLSGDFVQRTGRNLGFRNAQFLGLGKDDPCFRCQVSLLNRKYERA